MIVLLLRTEGLITIEQYLHNEQFMYLILTIIIVIIVIIIKHKQLHN